MRKFMRTRSPPGSPAHANGHAGPETPAVRWWEPPPYEDPEFPPCWRALGDARAAIGLRWRRPHELSARPTFLGATVDGEREELADRWRAEPAREAGGAAELGAAAAALALTPSLLARALPLAAVDPSRPYTFRFWVFGEWREVTVDDRLPVRRGRPLAASLLPHDYTLPLLAKAFAKLHGSYAAAARAGLAGALRRLAGGVVQAVRGGGGRLARAAAPRATLAVCPAPDAPYVLGAPAPADLIHVRAAWDVPPDPRDRWMSVEEFGETFERLVLVHVGPDDWLAEPALRARRPWRAVHARRRWRTGFNAGGAPACRDTTAHNPQFHVEVPRAEAGLCHVVVALAQRDEPAAAARPLALGFTVYEVPPDAPRAPSLRSLRALDVRHESRAGEVAAFFTLAAGRYLVVPHTRRRDTDAAFLLRLLTDERVTVWEVNEENTILRSVEEELAEAGATGAGGAPGDADEVEWAGLRAALRGGGAGAGACRALVALRDAALRGRVARGEAARLAALAARWRHVWAAATRRRALSSYRLRGLLAAAGVTVSNKVLEALVVRFARGARLTLDDYVAALALLHLAHERYRILDAKIKSNPLSLEEMILMTIYS